MYSSMLVLYLVFCCVYIRFVKMHLNVIKDALFCLDLVPVWPLVHTRLCVAVDI